MVERNRDKCRGGFWLCAEAASMWDEVGRRYDAAAGNPSEHPAWRSYDRALALYNAHQPHNDDRYAPDPHLIRAVKLDTARIEGERT